MRAPAWHLARWTDDGPLRKAGPSAMLVRVGSSEGLPSMLTREEVVSLLQCLDCKMALLAKLL